MRYLVVGSSHYTDKIIKLITMSDPSSIIFFVERSSEVSETIAKRHNATPISGNLEDPQTYSKAEIDKADYVIAITDSDALNLKIASIAKGIYKVPRVIVYLQNSLNVELAKELEGIEIINLEPYFEYEVLSILSSDSWVEVPLRSEFGIKVFLYRFLGNAELGITPQMIKQLLSKYEYVDVLFFTPLKSLIENMDKKLSKGDYIVVYGENQSAVEAKEAISKLINSLILKVTNRPSPTRPLW